MLVYLFHVKHCACWGFLSNLNNRSNPNNLSIPSLLNYSPPYATYLSVYNPSLVEGLGVGPICPSGRVVH